MFSKILIKLIDQAIVPAILLLVTRVASMLILAKSLGYDYELANSGFVFSQHLNYITVNSYSLLSMYVVLSLGVFYILLKSIFFHETHIEPKTTAKLFSLRLTSFIQTSFDLYSQGAVWLSYIYLLFLSTALMVFFGFATKWIFFVGLGVVIVSTLGLVFDLEQELSTNDEELDEILDVEEYVLTFRNTDRSFDE